MNSWKWWEWILLIALVSGGIVYIAAPPSEFFGVGTRGSTCVGLGKCSAQSGPEDEPPKRN